MGAAYGRYHWVVVQFEIYFTHYNFVRIHQNLEDHPGNGGGSHYQTLGNADMVKVLEDWEGAN
jgi:hypothetical protein